MNQVCNNFKDPGVQHYGGKLFESLRDNVSDIFNKYPIEIVEKKHHYRGGPSRSVTRSINSATYNDRYGGCIAQNCLVKMKDESLKKICEIEKGDDLYYNKNKSSRVKCVIHMKSSNYKLSTLNGGLKITPWHPIFLNNKWVFPENITPSENTNINEVYNFILEDNHSIYVNGYECITLGHGIIDDEVAKHDFFGTRKIVECMKNIDIEGFNNGYILLENYQVIRNSEGNVCGINKID